MKKIFFLALLFCLTFAQYYQVYLVLENSTIYSPVYDDPSFSYTDNSMENPNIYLRICSLAASDLQNKWVALVYADGINGEYLEIDNGPVQITSVPPTLCVNLDVDISSFRAWYPSIPFLIIADNKALTSSPTRWKLSTSRGWFIGNYTTTATRVGNVVYVNVTGAVDDSFTTPITPVVDYLVVGIVEDDGLTTTDTEIVRFNQTATLSLGAYTGNYTIMVNGIGGEFPPYVRIISPEPKEYPTGDIPFIFTIIEFEPIDSCWYVLDNQRHDLPDCHASYILSGLSVGTHDLCLYANDTSNRIGSDCVVFSISRYMPPPPVGGIAVPPGKRPPPPIPPAPTFKIIPEELFIQLELVYPYEASDIFSVCADYPVSGIECGISGPYSQYYSVELSLDSVNNTCINGTVYVKFPVEVALDIDTNENLLYCYAQYNNAILAAKGTVYTLVLKPELESVNLSYFLYVGQEINATLPITNIGKANATNITVETSPKYEEWIGGYAVESIAPGEVYPLSIRIKVPENAEPGRYRIPITIMGENTRAKTYYIDVTVKPMPEFIPCAFDFNPLATIWPLILAMLQPLAVFEYYREEKKWKEKSIQRSLFNALLLVILWLALFYFLASKCLTLGF
ncbi:MAG: hypothetical protein ACP5KP_04465 [Candidatus Micrarchaeia archaeon]